MKNILRNATEKLIELTRSNEWESELISHAPPILWFGNMRVNKNRILTIAANPSRLEVLHKNGIPRARVRILRDHETYLDIIKNDNLVEEIIESYNSYFRNDPYNWFGTREAPFNVECFIRGMNSSFYDINGYNYASLHIDLFPFPTRSKYRKLSKIVKRDLFKNAWARKILFSLVDIVDPIHIVVFGRANVQALFTELLETDEAYLTEKFNPTPGKTGYYSLNKITTDRKEYKCYCVSTNLGNPKPFNKDELKLFGYTVCNLA